METLDDFFEAIYGDDTGYAYVATKEGTDWKQYFFKWPSQKSEAVTFIQDESKKVDVYYGPALYSEPSARKTAIQSSTVAWCEFDGTIPETLHGIPAPHIRIRSSKDGHEHWYWRLSSPVGINELESLNRRLTYYLGADTSGWDATQVLRPPWTRNFKDRQRIRDVSIIGVRTSSTNYHDLDELLPTAPEPVEIPIETELPSIEDVIAKYAFTEDVFLLLKQGGEDQDRSKNLMMLGYSLAEMGLKDDEILSLLVTADSAWGKFKDRPDRLIRLSEIVTRSREKHPNLNSTRTSIDYFGFDSLLAEVPEVDWIWEGMLQQGGTILISGAPGIGKTQFALNLCLNFALGEDFLGFKVPRSYRVGFFSLEMARGELVVFYKLLHQSFEAEQITTLQEHFITIPVGEPLYLTNATVQVQVEELIEELQLDGVIFDSLGSTTPESLLSDGDARKIMDWNDRLTNRTGVFTGYIHHNRKASGDNRKPNKLADIYGSVYFTARPTTVVCLWENRQDPTGNSIECIPLKVRLAKQPGPFLIQRSFNLKYSRKDRKPDLPDTPTVEGLPVNQESNVVEPGKPGLGFEL